MTSSKLLRRTLEPVAGCLLVLAGLCAPVPQVLAQDAPRSDPAAVPAGQPILLQYKEVEDGVDSRNLRMSSQAQPFAKEPDLTGRNPMRGVLLFGTNRSNGLPFIWDRGRGKLYLDLNRNLDLTDDSKGTFSSRDRSANSYYQVFRGIRATFQSPKGLQRACFDLNVYASDRQPTFTITTRSFWEGRLAVQDRDLHIGVIENLTDPVSMDGAHLLIRPWAERTRGFDLNERPEQTVALCQNLYYGKQAYEVRCDRVAQGSEAVMRLQFNERSSDLGELRLTGQLIKRLVLESPPTKVTWAAVLDEPEPTLRVPVGSYTTCRALLAKGNIEAAYEPLRYEPAGSAVTRVTAAQPVILEIGGPLTNIVSVQRYGRSLRFAYELVGAAGRNYQLIRAGPQKAPRFQVVKDGKKIASGNFEFG